MLKELRGIEGIQTHEAQALEAGQESNEGTSNITDDANSVTDSPTSNSVDSEEQRVILDMMRELQEAEAQTVAPNLDISFKSWSPSRYAVFQTVVADEIMFVMCRYHGRISSLRNILDARAAFIADRNRHQVTLTLVQLILYGIG